MSVAGFSAQRLLPARDPPFQPLIQVLSYRTPQTSISFHVLWKNFKARDPPILPFRAILKISLDDLHFAAILSLSNKKLFQLCHPSILHSLALPVASIKYFCIKYEEYCPPQIPARTTDSTLSRSFLCNFGQIFLLINLNWTQCAFQSWDLFEESIPTIQI